MDPAYASIDVPGAQEVAPPPDDGWPGGMGSHDSPVRAWSLPSTGAPWSIVLVQTTTECCGGGDFPPTLVLHADGREWRLPSYDVKASADELTFAWSGTSTGYHFAWDVTVHLHRDGTADGVRTLVRLGDDGVRSDRAVDRRTSSRHWTWASSDDVSWVPNTDEIPKRWWQGP